MKRMAVHLNKTHIGDTRAIEGTFGHDAIEISIVYEDTKKDVPNALHFGRITIRTEDYDNFLKALNTAKKYVENDSRNDAVMIPFNI